MALVKIYNQESGGGGGVSSVTASSPLVSSGGANPNISIPIASTSVNGYISSSDYVKFNRKFGGWLYSLVIDASGIATPTSGQVLFREVDDEVYEILISKGTYDSYDLSNFLSEESKLYGSTIVICNPNGALAYLQVGRPVIESTYVSIPLDIVGGTKMDTLDGQICTFTFLFNPSLATINGNILYAPTNYTTSYALNGNLNGTTLAVGTYYIGIGSNTTNATATNRYFSVASGLINQMYIRTTGIMSGTLTMNLVKNGVSTALSLSIPNGSSAGKYVVGAPSVSFDDGDDCVFLITQTTSTSSGIVNFGMIIT